MVCPHSKNISSFSDEISQVDMSQEDQWRNVRSFYFEKVLLYTWEQSLQSPTTSSLDNPRPDNVIRNEGRKPVWGTKTVPHDDELYGQLPPFASLLGSYNSSKRPGEPSVPVMSSDDPYFYVDKLIGGRFRVVAHLGKEACYDQYFAIGVETDELHIVKVYRISGTKGKERTARVKNLKRNVRNRNFVVCLDQDERKWTFSIDPAKKTEAPPPQLREDHIRHQKDFSRMFNANHDHVEWPLVDTFARHSPPAMNNTD